ncbi:MAG: aminoacetone oxidase family FAD-binding enzyme, partial [Pseudomonadota bacterium]
MAQFDTIIIGAGAAGLMCAAQAPGRTLLVDHAKAAGEKIRISGGGRCNFTNMYAGPENYISHNPHFVKSALARYTQWDFIDWVARSGIAYHEKTLGQLFCDHSAKDIITMLTDATQKAGVITALRTAIVQIDQTPAGFDVVAEGPKGRTHHSTRNLVIATGGKPIPKMGATDFGLKVAGQFGQPVTQTFAGLVPYTFQGPALEMCKSLAGVAVPTTVHTGATFTEAALFTHRGLSGPAALQTSSYWAEGDPVTVNVLDQTVTRDLLQSARQSMGKRGVDAAFHGALPARLIPAVLQGLPLPARLGDLTAQHADQIADRLSGWVLHPNGTEGYRTA